MRYRILNFLLFVIRSYIRNKCYFCNDFCNDIEILDLISHQNCYKRGNCYKKRKERYFFFTRIQNRLDFFIIILFKFLI